MIVSDLQNAQSLRLAERCGLAMKEAKNTPGYPLSDATLRYIAALYDPRGCFESPWVPISTALSQKTRFFARGSFSAGTSGVGFVQANVNGDSSSTCVKFTQATSVVTPTTVQSAATNTGVAANNSPFASGSFGTGANQLQWRPVGAALYVRYAGTELNRGGDMLLFEDPNHADVSQYSYNTALNIDGVKRIPMDNEWHHVCVTPNNEAEVQFSVGTNYFTVPPISIFVNSASGAATPFEYEYYIWGEFLGSPARAISASYNDVVGFNCVQGAANMYMQLDSELGLDGFVRAIHAQQAQTSGVKMVGAPMGNWAGLLSFLPSLMSLISEPLLEAGKGALRGFTQWVDRKPAPRQKPQSKAPAKVVKAVVLPRKSGQGKLNLIARK